MFEIKFKIIENTAELWKLSAYEFDRSYDRIDGLFRVRTDDLEEGYYGEAPLCAEEVGDEMIDYWLRNLLEAAVILSRESGYASFKEIETPNIWVGFTGMGNDIAISILSDNDKEGTFCREPHGRTLTSSICSRYDLIKETADAANEFIALLKEINPELLKTNLAKRITAPLKQLERTEILIHGE